MWIIMGVVRNEHGVYHVRKKVPDRLQAAAARVLGSPRQRITWLKRSLRTKDGREANRLAKPVLIQFDHVLAQAEALTQELPLRSALGQPEIARIAAYHYASLLAEDDEMRRDGTDGDEVYASVANQLMTHSNGPQTEPIQLQPTFGLTEREFAKNAETTDFVLPAAQDALARGDISFVADELDELLSLFRINLDRNSASYRQLGMAVLRENVKALQVMQRRNEGDPIETPPLIEPEDKENPQGEGLRAAFEGWKKEKKRTPSTVREFDHALERFAELHGDLPVVQITRRHVREFREALQDIPKRRSGPLRRAPLPELVKWTKENKDAERIASSTVNKLLGACQTLARWARDNGIIPDDVPWADPFANMRLDEEEPEREPWEIAELKSLFGSPVFPLGARPKGGRGEAAFWLPLLSLFSGARLSELASLLASDVKKDDETGVTAIHFTEDAEIGRRLKTASSRRVVPVHPELFRLGFLRLLEERRKLDGERARLFPLLTKGPKGGFGEAWSKWFGRYIRSIGIANPDRVFHSFRHTFKDALRRQGVGEDVNDALTGHSGVRSVGRGYGAKEMVRRFGLPVLTDAVSKASYPGLDLSSLYWE